MPARQAAAIQGPWTAKDASHSSERREPAFLRLHTDAFGTPTPMSLSVPLKYVLLYFLVCKIQVGRPYTQVAKHTMVYFIVGILTISGFCVHGVSLFEDAGTEKKF